MKYITYMILFEDGYLYTGQTGNLHRRNNERRRKFGAGFMVVYREAFATRAEALARERQLKGWTRKKKEALIQGQTERLRGLSMRGQGEFL